MSGQPPPPLVASFKALQWLTQNPGAHPNNVQAVAREALDELSKPGFGAKFPPLLDEWRQAASKALEWVVQNPGAHPANVVAVAKDALKTMAVIASCMKPLFVPLASWAYDLFEARAKAVEYRLYGPRWNERTCVPGRRVVLSHGYGKARRLSGTVHYLEVCKGPADAEAWNRAFGRPLGPDERVAAIGITDIKPCE